MISPETIAYQHRVYRSSPFARKAIARDLVTNRKLDDFEITDEYANVNVQMLKAYLKTMGYGYEFSDEYVTAEIDDGTQKTHYLPNGDKIVCTDSEWEERIIREAIEQYYDEIGCFGGSVDEYNEFIEGEIQKVMLEKYGI